MSTTTSLHITAATPPPTARLSTYAHRDPIAAVELDRGALTICATDPADLFALAEIITDLATQLDTALAAGLATAMAATEVEADRNAQEARGALAASA